MATYRFSAQVIGRSSGRSATAAAAYRAGVEIVDERTGLVHDYTRRSGVDAAYIVAPESAPAWATDRAALWNAVEAVETRKDAQVAREVQLSLPHELTVAQRRQLVTEFVQQQWVDAGMVADVALHAPGREGDDRNWHAHVMLTMRRLDAQGFGQKVREWNEKALLSQWREAWAEHANRALERAGVAARVDHRTLEAQRADAVAALDGDLADDLDRAPEPRLGPVPTLDLRRSQRTGEPPRTERAEQWLSVRAENEQRRGLLRRLREGFAELAVAAQELARTAQERARQGMARLLATAQRSELAQAAQELAKAVQERQHQGLAQPATAHAQERQHQGLLAGLLATAQWSELAKATQERITAARERELREAYQREQRSDTKRLAPIVEELRAAAAALKQREAPSSAEAEAPKQDRPGMGP